LQLIPIFAGLKPEALGSLAESAEEIAVPAGTLAVREGEPGNRMYIIYSGQVEVIKQFDQPRQKILARLKTRDFFGEMCIIECVARSASVRAVEDTLLFAIKGMELYHLFRQWPDQYAIIILNIARDISRRLRRLDEAFSESNCPSV
jgi:CRP-like cAMP-binding protein